MNQQELEIPEIRFRNIGEETHEIILDEQNRLKKKLGKNRVSLSTTIESIIIEWNEFKKKKLL